MTEPIHISNALLTIMEQWKLKSDVLVLNESVNDPKLAIIADIFTLRDKLYKPVTNGYNKAFDELYDKSVSDLEVELCGLMAEYNIKWKERQTRVDATDRIIYEALSNR